MCFFFFFKQKTAYEMRISDWSSDVCSSDLGPASCSWWAGGMLAPWCEGESAEEPVVLLGAEAADWWERHAGGVTRRGTLVVAPARDVGELRRFARDRKSVV